MTDIQVFKVHLKRDRLITHYMLHILLRLYCMIKGIYNHCSNQC